MKSTIDNTSVWSRECTLFNHFTLILDEQFHTFNRCSSCFRDNRSNTTECEVFNEAQFGLLFLNKQNPMKIDIDPKGTYHCHCALEIRQTRKSTNFSMPNLSLRDFFLLLGVFVLLLTIPDSRRAQKNNESVENTRFLHAQNGYTVKCNLLENASSSTLSVLL